VLTATVLTAQGERTPLRPLPKHVPEIVLSGATEGAPVAEFGLGDGGVARRKQRLRFHGSDGCVTPGGVRVACRRVGVKLTFPSGRELLLAPDGALHLRSGEAAGPFPAGVEFLLADGSRVQVLLAQSRKNRVRDVWVVHKGRVLRPWLRGSAARKDGRERAWAGVRIACCGDGGDLYRPMALGAMVVLDRVLVPDERRDETPRERLVVLTDPLRKSLARMPRQHRETKVNVRRAVAAVTALSDRSDVIFPAGAALRRAEHDRLRWLLEGGFEVELDLQGPLAPRLMLFAGASPLPMVEWTLGAAGAAYLTNPNEDQLGKRWHGNGTRMPRVAPELQVRDHLQERQHALKVLHRMADADR